MLKNENTIPAVRNYLIVSIVLYVLLCAYSFLLGYKNNVPSYLEAGRLLVVFNFLLFTFLAFTDLKPSRLFLFNAILFFTIVIVIKYLYVQEGLSIFGGHKDSDGIIKITMHYGDKSFGEYVDILINKYRFNAADLGIFATNYFLYQLNPDKNFIAIGILFFSTIALFISTVLLYKIQLQLEIDKRLARLSTIFFVAFPYTIWVGAAGLKEIVFVTLILASLYLIVRVSNQRRLSLILLASVAIAFTGLFRTVIMVILLLTLIVAVFVTERSKKLFLWFSIVAIIIGGILLPTILEYMFGRTEESTEALLDYRFQNKLPDGWVGKAFLWFLGLFGPLPNLSRDGTQFICSIAMFLKGAFTLSFLLGVYEIIKKELRSYYPLVIFALCNIAMVSHTGVGLDMRFHYTYMPVFFVIAFNSHKNRPTLYFVYLFLYSALVYLYMMR